MIDLHLHLDGSLLPSDLKKLARLSSFPLPTEEDEALFSLLSAKGARSLNEYLDRFVLPVSVMQSGEAVSLAVTLLANRLRDMGYEYAEIRFAPLLHTKKGASIEKIAESAVEGMRRSSLPMGLIFCCMRGQERKLNERTVELAAEFKSKGVVGVDLAGAEALYPTESYKEIFDLARRFSLNITIHAGEAAGSDSVRAALDFGAKRIGHGVRLAEDEALQARVKRDGVTIEVCLTSNLQTGAVRNLSEHPVRRFLEQGIPCALCSDNMVVSDTDVSREWSRLSSSFGFGEDVRTRLEENARRASFSSFARRSL